MKAIGYTRCSTNEQADSGLGLEAQAERIRAYCTMRGSELLDLITDAGVSGGKPWASRDGGQRLLTAIRGRTAAAAGRFMLVVLAGAAEMERNLTRERTRSAMAVKRGNGQRIGTVPYGYDLAEDGTTLVLNEVEQAVVADLR